MSTAYTTHTHTARARVKERERDRHRERERSIDFVFDKITKKISRFLCLHRIITQHSATLSTHTNTCTRTHHCMHVLPPQLLRSPHENCFCHTHRKGFTCLYSFFPLVIVVYFIANLFYVICTLSMSIKMINYCTRNINKYLKKLTAAVAADAARVALLLRSLPSSQRHKQNWEIIWKRALPPPRGAYAARQSSGATSTQSRCR